MLKHGLIPTPVLASLLEEYKRNKVVMDIETVSGILYENAVITEVQTDDEGIEEEEHDSDSSSVRCFHLEHTHSIYIWFTLKAKVEEDGETEEITKELEKVPVELIDRLYLPGFRKGKS